MNFDVTLGDSLTISVRGHARRTALVTSAAPSHVVPGYGEEFADFIDLERLGGFIVKGTTLNHREGLIRSH